MQALELAQAMTQLGAGLPKLQALDLSLKEAKEQEEAYTRANRCCLVFCLLLTEGELYWGAGRYSTESRQR